MFCRHVFGNISGGFRGISCFWGNFAGFRGNTWISRVRDHAKYQKPCTKDVLWERCVHLKDSNAILMTHTLAHFSSALLKEQMITSVRNVNYAGQINAKLIDFSKICPKHSIATSCFLLIVSRQSLPRNFRQDQLIFLPICPENPIKFDFFCDLPEALHKCHGWI